ncbi:cytochrome P450 [Dentipellis sp. KUC8613]|nr:cytochrome P450 [Dentipellis sp. KUC8613]
MPIFAISIAVIIILPLFLWLVRGRQRTLPFPPGPPGLPLVGNALNMPANQEWKEFARWGDKYGSILHVSLFGQHLIILDTLEVSSALLDKRSNIYSDRPSLYVAGEVMGFTSTLALLPYGPRMRESRRLMHRLFGTEDNLQPYHASIEAATSRLLVRLLGAPEKFRENLRLNAGAIILGISHGYKVKDKDDPFVRLTKLGTEAFSQALRPGAFLADLLPILRYVPDWAPGTAWKQKAQEWAATANDMVRLPHEYVKTQMARTALPSFTLTELLQGAEETGGRREEDVMWAASGIVGGASAVSASTSFFLAMVLYPDVQREAQAELDAIVGSERLPCLADRARLPYIDALVKEVLRWNPIFPLGGPHCLMEDDVYNGYHIPKGSTVIANIWKILHDEERYNNPMSFKPERFLDSPGKPAEFDPRGIAFGFGRRHCGMRIRCTGMILAEASLFMTCAMVLSVFDISASDDNPITEPLEYSDGVMSHPPPFKCNIVPRTESAVALIQTIGEDRDA